MWYNKDNIRRLDHLDGLRSILKPHKVGEDRDDQYSPGEQVKQNRQGRDQEDSYPLDQLQQDHHRYQ